MRTLILLLTLVLGACAAPLPGTTQQVSLQQVWSGEAIFGDEPLPRLERVEIMGVDAPMREFLDRYVDRNANSHLRLQQLIYAVINDHIFGLNYTEATRTAAGTFAAHNGNCLSFTTMFIAMAREVGLKANFQEVDIPPDWEQRGDTFVLNRHINVLLSMGPASRKAVDFNIDDFKSSYDRREVPDHRAYAHYYSNVAVEKLQAGNHREAFLYLREGLRLDRSFSPLWTNLGALYSRLELLRHAETSYLEALRFDERDTVAISNLARIYDRLGEPQLAAAYEERARYHRERNPYYRFGQAREAFLQKQYERALDDLDFAIKAKPIEDAFYFLRGIVQLQLGNTSRAREDLQRAEELAGDEALKRNYHSKMEMLLSDQ